MTLILDSVLADTLSIPWLDGLVSGSRDNLPVVRGGGHILGMAYKLSCGGDYFEIQEAQNSIPGT